MTVAVTEFEGLDLAGASVDRIANGPGSKLSRRSLAGTARNAPTVVSVRVSEPRSV
jgi:hypothetical protein